MNWNLLLNSLLVSGAATLLAVVWGTAAALCALGLPASARRWFVAAAVVALTLPPFLVTGVWIKLLGQTGVWRAWLPLDIYTLGGCAGVLAFMLWPVALLALLAGWSRLERSQVEADPLLTGFALLRYLLLPMARGALAQAAVLIFVLALNNFAVPAILQVKVITAEIWVSFNTRFDYATALAGCWPLVIAPGILLLWLRRHPVAWPHQATAVTPRIFRRRLGRPWFFASALTAAALLALAVVLPLGEILTNARMWTALPSAAAAGSTALGNSTLIAGVTATVSLAIGLAIWRWPFGPALWLPFLVPGVLLGIVLIFFFNRPTFQAIYGSLAIVLGAFAIRYLAWGWTGARLAHGSVDSALVDAARVFGASRWQRWRLAEWPQMAPLLAGFWYVTYLLCLWDVETLVLIVPPGGETASLRIFNLLHYGHNAAVDALCLMLLGLALTPLGLWALGRRLFETRRSSCAVVALGAACLVGCSREAADLTPVRSQIFSAVKVIGTRGTGAGQFNKPRSVAVDLHDNLYVVDMTGRVQKLSPEGEYLASWQMPETDKGRAKGMCADLAGNIVVLEPHYSRVNHFSPDGRLVAQWGIHGTNAGQLAFPRAAAVNAQGEIYISEYGAVERVQRFARDGREFLNGFGGDGDGPGQFSRAEGLGLDPQGRVYVADSCNHRIQVFSREGRFLRTHGRPGSGRGEMSYPYDVRLDAEGRHYVCEFGNSRVQVFDAEDRPVETLGGPGGAPDQMSNPWSIALDSAGNLYVADSGNHRVLKFLRSGQTVTRSGRELTTARSAGSKTQPGAGGGR